MEEHTYKKLLINTPEHGQLGDVSGIKKVVRQGNSLVLTITKETELAGIKEGDIVRFKIWKVTPDDQA